MIKLIRIDYRLIHGQVVFTWVNNLNLSRLIVIDDGAASDETRKMSLKMSIPHGVKFNVFTVKDALARKNKIKDIKDNTALIFGDVVTCLEFIQGFDSPIDEINYGGIPSKVNAKEFDKAVFLDQEEILASLELINLDYKIYSQQTPSTKKKELNSLIEKEREV